MKNTQFLNAVKEFLVSKESPEANQLVGDTLLVESGIVDSILLTELIIFVEDYFGIVIDIDGFNIKSFATVNAIEEHYAS